MIWLSIESRALINFKITWDEYIKWHHHRKTPPHNNENNLSCKKLAIGQILTGYLIIILITIILFSSMLMGDIQRVKLQKWFNKEETY